MTFNISRLLIDECLKAELALGLGGRRLKQDKVEDDFSQLWLVL